MNKENGKRALIITFVCAPARRVTVLRTEYPHFVRRFRLAATRALPSTRKGDAFCRSTPLALRATSPTGGDTPLTPDLGLIKSKYMLHKL